MTLPSQTIATPFGAGMREQPDLVATFDERMPLGGLAASDGQPRPT
jgi:hypothetical protein